MDIRLAYQPYTQQMSIFLDDRPISMVSALSRYQTLPFASWYADILPALAFEVNDSFQLTFVGRSCEYRLLQKLLPSQRSCLGIRHEKHPISDSALMRIKKLSRLVVNGISCSKFNYPLEVYTDIPVAEAEEIVRGCLPRLSFCRLNVSIHNLQELDGSRQKHTSIALLSRDGEGQLRASAEQTCGVVAAWDGIDCCMDEAVVLYAAQEDFGPCLDALLELVYWPQLLNKALARISVPQESPSFPEVFALDKTEPQCIVTLPKSIELGQSVPVQVSTIPKCGYTPNITCRVSNDTVISYGDGCLTAVGTGEAIVEVYESGKIVPLHTASVTAFRRNRISKIQMKPTRISMCVGENAKIKYSCIPADADNLGALRLLSDEGTVVGVTDQEHVVARRPGNCCLFYEAEKVQSNVCEVTVFPRLEKLKISMEKELLEINSMTPVTIRRTPADAKLDKLMVTVEPPELGTYDVGSGQFFARIPGSGRLIVTSDRCNVTDSVPFHIPEPKKNRTKPILIVVGIIALFLLLKILLKW